MDDCCAGLIACQRTPSDGFPKLGLRASPHRRPRQVRRCRHPHPRLWWWSHLPDLRHPPGHRQVHRCLLPEVRRRALQEPAEAGLRPVRPHPARCRQPPRRAQEVRWSRCSRQIPEVLPLKWCCWLVWGRSGAVPGNRETCVGMDVAIYVGYWRFLSWR